MGAKEGCFKSVKLLLDCNANREVTDQLDRLPRDIASERHHQDILRLLTEHNPGNQVYMDGVYRHYQHQQMCAGAVAKPKKKVRKPRKPTDKAKRKKKELEQPPSYDVACNQERPCTNTMTTDQWSKGPYVQECSPTSINSPPSMSSPTTSFSPNSGYSATSYSPSGAAAEMNYEHVKKSYLTSPTHIQAMQHAQQQSLYSPNDGVYRHEENVALTYGADFYPTPPSHSYTPPSQHFTPPRSTYPTPSPESTEEWPSQCSPTNTRPPVQAVYI